MESTVIYEVRTCPHCHESFTVDKKVFANHVRWCDCNPKYEELRNATIDKNKKAHPSQKKTHEVTCVVCGEKYTVCVTDYKFSAGKYKKTCSGQCAKKLTHINSDEHLANIKRSNTLMSRYADTPHSRKPKLCVWCGTEFTPKKSIRTHCSQECATAHRISEHYNKLLLSYNTICDIDIKTVKDVYHAQCAFRFSLNDYPNEFDFEIVNKNGWYKASNMGNNLCGVSRDHRFSVTDAFVNHIDPYLISHPANCCLMQHTENQAKGKKSSITIDELISLVTAWNDKYGVYPNKINYDILKSFGIDVDKFEHKS